MVKKLNESKLDRDYYVRQVANYRKYIGKIRDLLPELETAYAAMQQYLEDNDVSQLYLQEADRIITNVMDSWSDLDKAELAASQIIGRYGKSGRLVKRESKLRTRKRSIEEDMEDKKYKAYAYLDLHRRNGLMDSIETDDFEELRDWCWEKIHDGVWLSVDNDETGSYACLKLPEDAEYLDYYDLDDCIIRKDSAKEVVSFNDLY